ncbi:aconitate hydratase AcnA [Nakamurella lactea]|uniref:aconitate hydratase AcnA n=1 Tax=Nakamurella lactea TaxID=459515 RepID=UPI0003FAD15B|nr:aconitate hydratase AcnA [Nakamurella lactea]
MIGLHAAAALDVDGRSYQIHALAGRAPAELPYTMRIVLENLLRHDDGSDERAAQIAAVCNWGDPAGHRQSIDVHGTRVFLHDTNGVPALVDLAGLRDGLRRLGGDPALVNPLVPAELVIDHSIVADYFGRPDALARNIELEYQRNAERYEFLRWGAEAFDNFTVVPPGNGIMHQINLEYLARVVMADGEWVFPDLCLGTDSHTTMVNGLGVLGWGVGGIEAESVMLGEPVSMLLPPVVGVRLAGTLPAGSTATDLVLTITERLRAHGVVGSFVEYFGPGVSSMSLSTRATIANMSPEMGSTCGYFPIDAETISYLRLTGRPPEHRRLVEAYAREQGLWHNPDFQADYSSVVQIDLADIEPSVAGPRRPQDRVSLADVRRSVLVELTGPSHPAQGAAAGPAASRPVSLDLPTGPGEVDSGSVVIAAITSCTNTANPSVMVAAGLLARNAVRRGLRSKPWVKTTLSPGSRVVTNYLDETGLTKYLEQLGFHLAGFGCMTCIGASGTLVDQVAAAVDEHNLTVAAVLSGNRNFEGRINPSTRLNYLASPPLVIAYALAGTMRLDLTREPLGVDQAGREVYLHDIWPDEREVAGLIATAVQPEKYQRAYRDISAGDARWNALERPSGETFDWRPSSHYLRRAPYLDDMTGEPAIIEDIVGARVLALLGDSVTTDHISPAGAIPVGSVAGRYLAGLGLTRQQLSSYAARRGNHQVMMRGTFANLRLQNQLVTGVEGGYTRNLAGSGEVVDIYRAAMAYRAAGTPQVVLAGRDYGTGSSRDWAAKGPALLGVRAVLAQSFERIHRSNLIGMGILPLEFLDGQNAGSLGLTGTETIDILGLADRGEVGGSVIVRADGQSFRATVRIDTPREATYLRHGGVMPYVLRRMTRPAAEQRPTRSCSGT